MEGPLLPIGGASNSVFRISHFRGWRTPESFMLTTVELSSSKLVRILVPVRVSGSGALHGANESNAWLAGLESAPGPAGLAHPICCCAPPITKAPSRLFPVEALVSEIF